MTEISISRPETPSEFPKSFGLMKYASMNWSTSVNIMNMSAWIGFTSRSMKAPIAPPIIGPKVGIRLVIAMIIEIRPEYCMPIMAMNSTLVRPTISASIRLNTI